jgi:hypothetical protein
MKLPLHLRHNANNRLFVLAQSGRGAPSIAAAMLWTAAASVIMVACQVGARGLLRPFWGEGSSTADTLAEFFGFSSIFVVLWLLLRFWRRRQFSSLGFESRGWIRHMVMGAAMALVTMAATTVGIVLIGASIRAGELQTRGAGALGLGLLTLLATTVQSSSEEALFRGWLLPAIGNRLGVATGVILSSSVFMLAHATTEPPPLGWINLFLFGCLAALLAVAEGGLWAVSTWHAIWNWAQGGLLGFSVDRSVHHYGLIASIRATGPDFVTGGTFGPEGGIIVTSILVVSIAGFIGKKLR